MPTTHPSRPAVLNVGFLLCAVGAAAAIAGVIAAPFDIGTYKVNGTKVSGPEFLRVAGVPILLMALPMLLAAFGLWRHRPWSRSALLTALGIAPLITTLMMPARPSVASTPSILVQGLFSALIWLYLYRNRHVLAYYAAIQSRQVDAA